MKSLLLIATFLFTISASFAQKGRIEGKITDSKTGNPLAGVTVLIKETGKGIATNLDGRFVLNIEPGKKYTLVISSTNYQGKEVNEIETGSDGIAYVDVALDLKATTGEEVVVKATSAKKESVNALISFQRTTNTVASVISAEAIRRSPDKNTGEVLKRTPGASLVDGKFLVVRGLADRYNQAMLNGILLTSTEPDRKTFSFDIIPAPMIDNIIINKAFVPELPGEWAGGLIQVNTKDIPSKGFFNIQIGTGFNTQTVGNDFYKAKGGKLDWLGIEDGTRALPDSYKTKSDFNLSTSAQKASIGRQLNNNWAATSQSVSPNVSLQLNGGFNGKIFGKKIGGIIGINYSKSNRFTDVLNQSQELQQNGTFGQKFSYRDNRYTQEVTLGGLASFTLQFNPKNKVSLKSIVNVNTNNYAIQRKGINNNIGISGEDVKGGELTFKENTFFTIQINGEHNITAPLKFKWYGSYNILDGYSPDQRRYQYTRTAGTQDDYQFLIGNSLAQESGSRIFQTLNDYIYTGGGDLSYNFNFFKQKQTVKAGYMLQIKDRLYNAQLFANFLPTDNKALRLLSIDQIFAPANFGDGASNSTLFSFGAINNKDFRYIANTILNAGFLQFDNQLSKNLRVVWGLRVENYDQLLGSVKQWDSRHKHTEQTDFLPGLNATYKLNTKTNLRLSTSQTVIRPEQRELSALSLYDFELNATVQGNPNLKRTKVTNLDLRYEFYPRAGEVVTAGVFYKNFKDPIEQNLQQGGAIFQFDNPEKAVAFGFEVEFRKKLDIITALKNFTVQANGAYIYSKVTDSKNNTVRPLQGQSPYLLNIGMMYDLEKLGVNATLLYNQIGRRIYLVGNSDNGDPSVWEAPRPLLDFQLGKKLMKNKAELRLNISDLLNRTQYFYQNNLNNNKFEKGKDAYRFTRRFGTTFGLTFNYSL
jgi:hypothetical protein